MKQRLAKLIDVKSIITIVMTTVFAYLAVAGKITGDQFLVIFTTVVAFYFGTQKGKADGKEN